MDDLPRPAYRAMMFYDFKKGLTARQCSESLESIFKKSAPKYKTIILWYKKFREGRVDLEDEPRSGRPASAVNDDNITQTRNIIEQDPHVTYKEIAESLQIGYGGVTTIIRDHLRMRKVSNRFIPLVLPKNNKQRRMDWCKFMIEKYNGGQSKELQYLVTCSECWIYNYGSESEQESNVWIFGNDDNSTEGTNIKDIKNPVNKKMIAVFIRKRGPAAVIPLEQETSVPDPDWYCQTCFPQLFEKLNNTDQNRSTLRGVALHNDNPNVYSDAKTLNYLFENEVQLINHPSHSPDLAPCDFFLFPTVKNKIRRQVFSTANEAIMEFKRILEQISSESYADCFSNWFVRMDKCIRMQGDYVEH